MGSTTPGTRHALASLVAAAFIAATAFFLTSGQAHAHAVLVSSSPSQGERLSKAPSTFTLRFSEPVTHVGLSLTDRYGRSRDLEVATSGATVMALLKNTIDDGAYALNWRAVSDDGHPVRAAIVFLVGSAGGMQQLQRMATDHGQGVMALSWLARLGFCACALFGIGGVFFAYWVEDAPPGRAGPTLLWAAWLCGVTSLGLLGVEETGSSLVDLASTGPWLAAIDGSFARSVGLGAVSLLLSLMASAAPRHGRSLSMSSLVTIGPAFALTGHTSDAEMRWLSAAAISIHIAAACFWAGALPRLLSVLRPGRPGRSDVLRRFSEAIPLAIAGILLPGAYLAWIEIGNAEAVWRTLYGNVLLVKLTLVALALLLGGYNRVWLTDGVIAGNEASSLSMRRTISIEVVLIAFVLSATALFRFAPPPRALALQAPAYASVHLHGTTAMATLSFWTRSDLGFDVEVSLADAAFHAFDAREVTLKMSSSDGSVAPFVVPVRKDGIGLWRAHNVQAPCDCDWNVSLGVLVSDFDMLDLDGRVKLSSRE